MTRTFHWNKRSLPLITGWAIRTDCMDTTARLRGAATQNSMFPSFPFVCRWIRRGWILAVLPICFFLAGCVSHSAQRKSEVVADLHDAAAWGEVERVKGLLDQGADVNAEGTCWGATPLWTAAHSGQKEVCELLIARGADIDRRNRGFDAGMTPLHRAVLGHKEEVVRLLIAKGADVDARARGARGQTALELAASDHYSNPVICELLIAAGANLAARDPRGGSLLHWAARRRRPEICELLIAAGVDVNVRDARGRVPLHWAAQQCNHGACEFLIKNGGDTNAKDEDGKTPLLLAFRPGDAPCVETYELLLTKGADVNAQDKKGKAALHLAVDDGQKHASQTLLSHAADPNAKDEDGHTPLHLAVRSSQEDITELLLANGADANAQDKNGRTPLHLLDQYKLADVKICSLLLAKGADVHAKDRDGRTPLFYVIGLGAKAKAIVDLLLTAGADANATDNDGTTLLQLAREKGQEELAQLLRDHGARETPGPTEK